MTTMVEKVAKVIYEAHGLSYDGRTINAMGEAYGQWARAVNAARAAIEAIMEPTDEMVDAGREHDRGQQYLPYGLFTAMIQAALKEEGQ